MEKSSAHGYSTDRPVFFKPLTANSGILESNAFKKFLVSRLLPLILFLNRFKSMPTKATPKAEETGLRILEAALDLFRQEGFESATMRDIARAAGVATGAAYYYYPSKDAIVMDFYQRACAQMQPQIETAIGHARGLEDRLCAIIRVKLVHFAPNRGVLRALLKNGADPKHPLSPFSVETKDIRDIDIAWFQRIIVDCGIRIPRDLEPELPGVLWFFQMGVIYFWVIDESPRQARTEKLLELAAKNVATLVRLSSLPLMRPVRRLALELIEIVKEPRPSGAVV
jgi:AcrR family transcriptional regulator